MAYEADRRVITESQRLQRLVAARVRSYCTAEWTGLGSWRDDDISRFIGKVIPVVRAGEKQVSQLTNSYLDSLARAAGLAPLPPATVELGDALRGVAMDEVYRRPAATLYTALSEGKSLDEAVRLGELRLSDLVLTDLQLAQTHTARGRMSGSGVAGYRRVLTGAENCALCALASTQRYHKADLMPIHPGCDCTVAPIFGDRDPGQVINPDLLDSTMKKLDELGVKSHYGTDGRYRDATEVVIREHGEYGPTLSWRNQGFTSQADLD
jgi:hypothetical protein